MEPGNRVKVSDLGKKSMIRLKRLNIHGTIKSVRTIKSVVFCIVLWDERKTTERINSKFLEVIGMTSFMEARNDYGKANRKSC